MVARVFVEALRHAEAEQYPYAWIITRDRYAEVYAAARAAGQEPLDPDYKSAVGLTGPRNAPEEFVAVLRDGGANYELVFERNGERQVVKPVEFRMVDEGDLDADEEDPGTVREGHPDHKVIYEGLLLDPDQMWDFGPLEDYGMPTYTAIGIQYRDESGEWRDL
jgi:hypothetical protein